MWWIADRQPTGDYQSIIVVHKKATVLHAFLVKPPLVEEAEEDDDCANYDEDYDLEEDEDGEE